jgi:hypothetical protein
MGVTFSLALLLGYALFHLRKSERAEPVVAMPDHLIAKFAGNEKERQGLRQRADVARMRRNS